MSGLSVLDWAARILLGALVAGAIGVGAFFALRMSGDDDPQVMAQLTQTAATLAPTDTPPTPTPTKPTVTQPPPTAPLATDIPQTTSYPPLPPPPPRPENPSVVQSAAVAGGQWYEFEECFVFYLPSAYDFIIHVAINDPSGDLTIAFEVQGLESAVVLSQYTGTEVGRTVRDPRLHPVFDQIASTFDKEC